MTPPRMRQPRRTQSLRRWMSRRSRSCRVEWNRFLATIRGRCGHEVQAALRTVRDIAVAQNNVAFAFGANDFTRKMVERPETLKVVAGALSDLLGRPVLLECQMGDKAQLYNVVGASPGTGKDDGPDPLVEYAVKELGARVIDPSTE